MELPFSLIDILESIESEPGILVFFAAFHPFALLLLTIPFWLFKKVGIYKPVDKLGIFGFSVVVILLVGWFAGFISQILLLFMEIQGLKMLFIYISMYFCITGFVIVNSKSLQKLYEKEMHKKALKMQ